MGRVVRGITLGAVVWLLCMSAARAEETRQSAPRGEAMVASVALSQAEMYSDPYRRYFSGHWCDCWRKANQSPIDEKAMFEGILPRTDTPVWQQSMIFEMKDMTADEKFLCRAASGLIHRVKGMWYCTEDDDFWFKGSRQFFKDGITGPSIKGIKQGNIGSQVVGFTCRRTGSDNYLVGVKRFIVELDPPSIDSCVIYDPALLDPAAKPKQPRDMLNVIRMMCAVERAVPLTPRLYQDLMKLMGGKPLPIVKDTTQWDEFNMDKFHGDEKAAAYALYAWAFNNFWNNPKNAKRQCNHHVLAYMPPMGSDDPEQDLTDYIVQWSLFTFYSYGGGNIDEKHMEYVLTQSPMNIPVIGQLTDKTGAEGAAERTRILRLFSRFGKYFVDSNLAGNLSMHSGQRDKERAVLKQKPAPPVTLDPAKNYIAFCLTANNSLGQFMTSRANHWDVASRGTIPLGWGIPLAAADVLPNVAKFYYKEAKPNDCFVADLGGLGLAYPTVWGKGSNDPGSLLAAYFQRTNEYLGYLGLSTMWAEWLDPNSLDSLAKNMTGLQAVFYGTTGANRTLERANFMQGNLPVFFTYSDVVSNAADLEKLPAALGQAKERFFFIGVDENGFGPNDDVVAAIAKTAAKLGDKFVVVRPDQLPALFADAVKAKQVPAESPRMVSPEGAGVQNPPIAQVAEGAIRIDGNVSEWTRIAAQKSFVTRDGRVVPESAKPADGEVAAEVTMAADSRFLYLLARVRDKEVIVDDADLTAGDHVELCLDTRRAPFRDAEMTEGFYRLGLVPASGLVKAPQLVLEYPTYDVGLASVNKHGIQEELSSSVSPDGYTIEAAIPLVNFPGGDFKQDGGVAVSLAVRNLDSRTAPADDAKTVTASASR